jgi:hypothetical protein
MRNGNSIRVVFGRGRPRYSGPAVQTRTRRPRLPGARCRGPTRVSAPHRVPVTQEKDPHADFINWYPSVFRLCKDLLVHSL